MSVQVEPDLGLAPDPQFADDCLPPEYEYQSREQLLAAINTWAASRGYAFTTRTSKLTTSGRRVVIYGCDRSWKPSNSTVSRKRQTTYRGNNCEFSVFAKESLDKATWLLKHRPNPQCSQHNHPPSYDVSAHPAHRKLDDQTLASVSKLISAGVEAKQIQTYIRNEHADSILTRQDIYNLIAKTKEELHRGQSSISALINQLDKEGFWSRVRVDENQHITAILFAHPKSLQYLQSYSDLLLLDCTYKTNRYQMPLFDMIGVDACQRSFCIAFAFLGGEQEEDYTWALERLRDLYEVATIRLPSVILSDRCLACINAIETVMPDAKVLLCLWHANKAVLGHCLPIFRQQEQLASRIIINLSEKAHSIPDGWVDFYNCWYSIIQSSTQAIFEERVLEFEAKYLPEYTEAVIYIKRTWLEPYKEKLAKAWVDQYMHFGNSATSRIEGIHALLKSYLKSSKFDLFDVWRSIKMAVENQLSELHSTQARQQIRKPTEHMPTVLFSNLHGWISHEALRKVNSQLKLLDKAGPQISSICTGTFTRTLGLPCAHKLQALQENGQGLRLTDFHTQWHLKKRNREQPLPILEPNRVESNVQRKKSTTGSTTRREPSTFENVLKKRKRTQCSRCFNSGHIRTSKSCPLRHQEALLESNNPKLVGSTSDLPIIVGWSEAAEEACIALDSQAQLAEEMLAPHAQSPSEMPTNITEDCVFNQARAPKETSLPYYSPEAIYERYCQARSAWYGKQPKGDIRTNQAYRKANGLPLRYAKSYYKWCLDYKEMGQQHASGQRPREWTKEEMTAYIDWDKYRTKRVDAIVEQRMQTETSQSTRRGMGGLWDHVDHDLHEEAALFENYRAPQYTRDTDLSN